MFSQNVHTYAGNNSEGTLLRYFKLYYQFLKHGFGMEHMPVNPNGTGLRIYLDEYPDSHEQAQQFKGFVLALGNAPHLRNIDLRLTSDNITAVRSHDHVLLQCLDIVLGAMAFRLNDRHLMRAPEQRMRGKRTRAKEKLYKEILGRIRSIRPGFNPGISTGAVDPTEHWSAPYRHWLFRPNISTYQPRLGKRRGGK